MSKTIIAHFFVYVNFIVYQKCIKSCNLHRYFDVYVFLYKTTCVFPLLLYKITEYFVFCKSFEPYFFVPNRKRE